MVPPYLAYYGALSTGNESITLLQEAYDQCRAYREILRDICLVKQVSQLMLRHRWELSAMGSFMATTRICSASALESQAVLHSI